jgi:hypothetical protein
MTFAMAGLSIFTLSFFLFIPSFFSTFSLAIDVPEVELLPLNKHGKTTSFQKRMEDPDDGYGGLDLQNFGIFLWGAQGSINPPCPNYQARADDL